MDTYIDSMKKGLMAYYIKEAQYHKQHKFDNAIEKQIVVI